MPGWLLALAACIENDVARQPVDFVGVAMGDFDRAEEVLDRLLVAHVDYEGFICCAAWDPDLDPDAIALKSETLFTGETDGGRELFIYDGLVVDSGTRGFGAFRYNGVEPDDAIVSDPAAVDGVRELVERGGLLLVSDWAYELVEAAWPDAVDFHGDGALDAAQVGVAGELVATVVDPVVESALGMDRAVLSFNFSNWAVVDGVGPDVTVHLQVDAELDEGGTLAAASATPVLVSFDAGLGHVVFSSFHWNAQTAGLADALLDAVAPELAPGGGPGDTGTATAGGGSAP